MNERGVDMWGRALAAALFFLICWATARVRPYEKLNVILYIYTAKNKTEKMSVILDEIEKDHENERGLGFSIALVLLFLLNCYYISSEALFLIDNWFFVGNSFTILLILNSFIYLIGLIGMWLMKKKTLYLFSGNIIITIWLAYDSFYWQIALLTLIYIYITFKFYLKVR